MATGIFLNVIGFSQREKKAPTSLNTYLLNAPIFWIQSVHRHQFGSPGLHPEWGGGRL